MTGHLLVLSGPNLGSLGARDPAIYGTMTLDELVALTAAAAARHDLGLRHVQSNHEGELIDAIEAREDTCVGILANLGAFTHTSVALHDALEIVACPVVEVHLSNPAAREPFRHVSAIAPVVSGSIAGFGALGYELAVDALVRLLAASDAFSPDGV